MAVNEKEEALRQLISMKRFLVKTQTALINRLHALYAVTGETGLKKNDLMMAGSRERMKGLIPHDTLGMIAETRERELETVEGEVAVYRESSGRARRRRVSPMWGMETGSRKAPR
jgi:hypothetical protein